MPKLPKQQRKQWPDSNMRAAIKELKDGKGNVSAVARKYSIPRRTLTDRISGRVTHGKKPGPPTAISKHGEMALVHYLQHMASRGFPLTTKMTRAFAWAIAQREGTANRFPKGGPSANWFTRFRKRHSELTLQRMDNLERSRAECLSEEVVSGYFSLLKKTLTDHNLMSKPRQIYNTDESFLPLNETKEKAVTTKNTKCVFSQSLGSTEHITLVCAASAAGAALPPMIIYPHSYPGGQYKFGGPDDALYAKSESGWIDSELFLEWVKRIFLKYAVQERPLLLIIDGHKSHLALECIDLCRANDIILLCLPPHTTHALQPLDVSVFKALKAHFSTALRVVCFAKKNFMVSKRDFAKVVKEPFEKAFSMSNIKSGFSKCGIYPFNPEAVSVAKMLPSEVYQQTASRSKSTDSPTSPTTPCSPKISSDDSTVLVTPSSSMSCVSDSSTSLKTSPIVNPLLAAGLVPKNLSDILVVNESASVPQRKRRVIKARVITEEEFYQTLLEKDEKEKAEKEAKKQRSIERERKKEEREKLKSAKAEEKRRKMEDREAKKAKKTQQQRKCTRAKSISSDSDGPSTPLSSRQSRKRKLPLRFIQDSSDSSGDESDTLCSKCNLREPVNSRGKLVFWIDCDSCDKWFHILCIGAGNPPKKYVCEDCSQACQ